MERFYEDYLARLERVHAEIGQAIAGLQQPALDWSPGPDMNSLAVLVVHLTGAERYWIGDVVGADPSGRDRDAEFRAHGLDATALQARLDGTLAYSRNLLATLRVADLAADRVSPRDGKTCSVADALLHALDHAALHAGHCQIMRQLVKERREIWHSFTVSDDL